MYCSTASLDAGDSWHSVLVAVNDWGAADEDAAAEQEAPSQHVQNVLECHR